MTNHWILLCVAIALFLAWFSLYRMRKSREVKPAPEPPPLPSDFATWYEGHAKQPYLGERGSCLAAWMAGQEALKVQAETRKPNESL